ncbi:LysM peptidoglycan-binding domain-containing protein [Paenibacillus polymyxa]|uniref:LysM domain-containing protein n=1 Tax=Paenibacillus polymyxa (strain SC2) TaxID=886882 RepID=E3EKD7_PAEPS|nr:LysM peptidoglycan-binding domain-containing protein [Paenibacillus polymyxa]ADO59464.1 hypothetical protein PPSC2_27745 [Paenibacillus polymyxa SC2]WPQ59697.1 LysM peptidoglycan-binding domain-containing protein [Paenibacillus polymyxa]
MRGKNKLLLTVLLITFVATSGMFYYQNVYAPKQDEKNKVFVLVAKKDISEGAAFTPDNIGAIKMDKNMVLPNFITNFDEMKGKTASTDLFSNEIVTKRQTTGVSDGSKKFKLGIEAANMPTSIKNGDAVRVFVQTTIGNKIFEIFDKKEVVNVNFKKSASGQESQLVESVDLLVSDKEAVTYFDAQKAGSIFIVRFNNLTEKDTVITPKYDMNSDEIKKLKVEAEKPDFTRSNMQEDRSADSSVRYTVRTGDTFESISKLFNVTPSEIKKLNPGVTSLSPGDKLNVKREDA